MLRVMEVQSAVIAARVLSRIKMKQRLAAGALSVSTRNCLVEHFAAHVASTKQLWLKLQKDHLSVSVKGGTLRTVSEISTAHHKFLVEPLFSVKNVLWG